MKSPILVLFIIVSIISHSQIPWNFKSGIYRESNQKFEKLLDVEYETMFAYDTILKKVNLTNVHYTIKSGQKLICNIDSKLDKGGVTITIIFPDYTSETKFIALNEFKLVNTLTKYENDQWLIIILNNEPELALVLINFPFMYMGKSSILHLLPTTN